MAAVTDTAVKQQPSRAVSDVAAKLPQKTQEKIAGLPQSLIDDNEASEGGFNFAGNVNSEEWRTETRFYTKKDGTVMMYFNYRKRETELVDGKRLVAYLKGGKKIWQPSKGKKKNTNSRRKTG